MASHLDRARAALFAGLALWASCAAAPNEPSSSEGTDPGVGSFSVELTAGGGFRFSQLSYDVRGNGFHKAAALDVAASTTL